MSGILLDTNVISEWVKPAPDPQVRRWATLQDPRQLYLSVLTIGELQKGIVRLPASARRARLESWLEQDLMDWFSGRILPVDEPAARIWGEWEAQAERSGRPVGAVDALLAATARRWELRLATRNLRDFERFDLDLVNPWRAAGPGR